MSQASTTDTAHHTLRGARRIANRAAAESEVTDGNNKTATTAAVRGSPAYRWPRPGVNKPRSAANHGRRGDVGRAPLRTPPALGTDHSSDAPSDRAVAESLASSVAGRLCRVRSCAHAYWRPRPVSGDGRAAVFGQLREVLGDGLGFGAGHPSTLTPSRRAHRTPRCRAAPAARSPGAPGLSCACPARSQCAASSARPWSAPAPRTRGSG